jgi:hypothetical protein
MAFIASVGSLWIIFYFYWLISAMSVKKAVRTTPWWKQAGIRLLLVIVAVLLTRLLHPPNLSCASVQPCT